jgi:hypothetical protein
MIISSSILIIIIIIIVIINVITIDLRVYTLSVIRNDC